MHLDQAIWPLVVLLTAFAVAGIPGIPFHPDESTQLYMSSDFELLFRDPLALAWTPDQVGDLRAHYRLIDAPLTKYWLGLARSLAGLAAPPTDWSWSKTWAENQAASALPDARLLFAGRLAVTGLLPLGLFFIYQIGSRLHSALTGLVAALLLGMNALVLLHDRRAMAEAMLTFGTLFVLWIVITADRRPWLAGLGLAVAFNAKQSGLALAPVTLLAAAWPAVEYPRFTKPGLRKWASAWAILLLTFGLLTWLLNPFLWRKPLQAFQAAIHERQEMVKGQVADLKRLTPEVALDRPGQRLVALLANLYFAPPAFAEAGNYSEQTRTAELAYRANPLNSLLRGFWGGGLTFALNLIGILLACLRLYRAKPDRRRTLILLLLSSLCLAFGLFWLAPLPWQRYIMPLAPLSCLWSAYAVSSFGREPA